MTKTLTFEYVKNYFKENKCELLDLTYINTMTKMKYKCICGNKSEIIFNNFKKGQRCKGCLKNDRKHSFEYIYNFFKEQKCELLETEYTNAHTNMKYKCIYLNDSEIRFNNFRNGVRCIECLKNDKKFDFDFVHVFFKKQNCELLETEYINAHTI